MSADGTYYPTFGGGKLSILSDEIIPLQCSSISAYAYLNQLPFLAANSHSFSCISTDLSVQGMVYDMSIYEFWSWFGFFCLFGFSFGVVIVLGGRGGRCFVLFFQDALNLTHAIFIEAFIVFVAVRHCSSFKPQLRTQDVAM